MKIGIVVEVSDKLTIKEVESYCKEIAEFAEELKDEMEEKDTSVNFLVDNTGYTEQLFIDFTNQ